MMETKEFIGREFGRLNVLSFSEKRGRHTYWECICKCGTRKAVAKSNLLNSHVRSCGCLNRESFHAYRTTHDLSKTPEFKAWWRMISRCKYSYPENSKSHSHRYYVLKGISVCERWANSFENFLSDMGPMPSRKHTLERVKNSLGYLPENCRWATCQEQALNRSTSVIMEYKGIKKNLCTWADELGVNRIRLRRTVIRIGSDEKAIEMFIKKGAS